MPTNEHTKLPKLRERKRTKSPKQRERERLRDRHDMLEGGEPYACPSCGYKSREVFDDASVRRTVVNNARCGSCGHTAPIDTFLSGRKPRGSVKGAPEAMMRGMDTSQHTLDRMEAERLNQMTFGQQFVELLGEFVDAREQYTRSRRNVGRPNSDDMDKAGNALQALLDKRFTRTWLRNISYERA